MIRIYLANLNYTDNTLSIMCVKLAKLAALGFTLQREIVRGSSFYRYYYEFETEEEAALFKLKHL